MTRRWWWKTAPEEISIWVCRSGLHVYPDPKWSGRSSHVPGLEVTGSAVVEDDGTRTPTCHGYRTCGDRRCSRVEYVRTTELNTQPTGESLMIDKPYCLVFYDSAGTDHVPAYVGCHATFEDACAEAERVYPDVVNAAAHTPLVYGPGLGNDGALALPRHRAVKVIFGRVP